MTEYDSIISIWAIPLLDREKMIYVRTSGSTGKYLDIYWKRDDYIRSMLPLWMLRKRYYNINPSDKVCYFFTTYEMENQKDYYYKNSELCFNKAKLSIEELREVYKRMEDFKPKWLLLQPSIAILLCQCMDEYNLEPIESICYIEMSGELLTDEVRKIVKKHFKCDIANQYGANEMNSIAYECPEGNMHIMESNVNVEILKNGKSVYNEEGEVCITTRTNSAMPLIRYKIGDYAKIERKVCKCGNLHSVLTLTSGRVNDYAICNDGSKVNSYVFVHVVDVLNYRYDGIIKQFKITQTAKNTFFVIFVIDEDDVFDISGLEHDFVRNIKDPRIADAIYEFKYLHRLIPDDKTGKLAYFKREIS